MQRRTIHSRAGIALLLVTLVALPAALGCASRDPGLDPGGDGGIRSDDDASAASDAGGPTTGGDASSADASQESDSGPADSPEGLVDGDPTDYANACLDGRDQNSDDALDCADISCAEAPSCCIGSSEAQCCTGTLPAMGLDFSACDASSCDALAGLVPFGSPGPIAVDGALAPIAGTTADSGALSLEDVDPRESLVTLEGVMAVPSDTTDIDAVAFGLTATTEVAARVTPLVAVVLSAARHDVTLQTAGEIVGSFPAPTDGGYHTYSLTIEPDGDVLLSSEGVTLDAHVALPAHALHTVIFGRATNPGSTETRLPARLRSLVVQRAECDAPAALSRAPEGVEVVDHTGSAVLTALSGPSVTSRDGETLLVFAAPSMGSSETGIFLATQRADGSFHIDNTAVLALPGASLQGPVLRDDGDHWTLFASAITGGVSRLVMSVGGAGHALAFATPSTLVVEGLTGDVDSPAPIPGTSMLVARHDDGTSTELVLLEASTDVSGAYAPEGEICGADDPCEDGTRGFRRIHGARVGGTKFDADEVASPTVIVVNHVYRLYYAGRRGSRWSIGMLFAADLGFWRSANDGLPVLDADGAGFDAVSVLEPSVLVEDGALALYYVGSDGVDRGLGVARGSSFGLSPVR